MSREEYTSLVMSASAIAMTGGSSVQTVAVRSISSSPSFYFAGYLLGSMQVLFYYSIWIGLGLDKVGIRLLRSGLP